MADAGFEERVTPPEFFGSAVPGSEASEALRRIARDESIKAYVQQEKPVHDALLGAARRFIGGERLGECVEAARRVNRRGHPVTIDHMGESTRDEATARDATGEFLRVVGEIRDRGLDSSVSLDLSHLGLVVDRELAFENAARLASAAEEAGLEVMVSMEGSERIDEVLGMYRRLSEPSGTSGSRFRPTCAGRRATSKTPSDARARSGSSKGPSRSPKTSRCPGDGTSTPPTAPSQSGCSRAATRRPSPPTTRRSWSTPTVSCATTVSRLGPQSSRCSTGCRRSAWRGCAVWGTARGFTCPTGRSGTCTYVYRAVADAVGRPRSS